MSTALAVGPTHGTFCGFPGLSSIASTFSGFPFPIEGRKMAMASFLVLEQPEVFFLLGPIAPGWFVSQPLRVLIERDEAETTLSDASELAVYGIGADRISALADYNQSLIEYYEIIEEESRANVPTAALFRHVGRFVTRSNR